MKKIAYSLLLGLFALAAAGCDDDDATSIKLAASTDSWSFTNEGGSQKLIIQSPGPWELTAQPEWCTITPASGFGSLEATLTCDPNAESKRKGTLTLTSGNETCTIDVTQTGAYVIKGYPVEWLFSKDESANYLDAFVDGNALPAKVGLGTLSFVQDPSNSAIAIGRNVGSTGHPYVTGTRKGDGWTFTVPALEDIAKSGHAILHIAFITRSSAGGPRYWLLEYLDGATWKPVIEPRKTTVAGESVSYNVDLVEDLAGSKKVGTDNAEIDRDFPLTAPLAKGKNLTVRFRCVANESCDGSPEPSETGTNRIAGAAGTSPVLSAISDE